MTLRDLFAEAIGRLPQAEPECCVHTHAEIASCQRCVTACPKAAWALDDDALGIDTGRCDGCGLCVAHCPEGALSLAGMAPERFIGQAHLTLVCPRAVARADAWQLPCVNAVGFRTLGDLYDGGLRRLTLQIGECRDCPRSDSDRLVQRVTALNRVLLSRGLPIIELADGFGERRRVETGGRVVAHRQPPLTRRGFLQRMVGSAMAGDPGASDSSARATDMPAPRPGDLALFVPQIDSRRCNGCDACTRICPHDALRLAPGRDAYLITADACTGCGLCVDVCDRDAVCVRECSPVGPSRVALERFTCRACGVAFHRPCSGAGRDSLCHVCERANHHRKLFQVL